MPVHGLEACTSFIAVNRQIAERLRLKARTLLELMQSVEDLDERMRIADLAQASDTDAAMHAALADAQERDLGVRCHCPPPASSDTDPNIDPADGSFAGLSVR